MTEIQWENISNGLEYCERAKVPNGWLYRTAQWVNDDIDGKTFAVTFVPELNTIKQGGN